MRDDRQGQSRKGNKQTASRTIIRFFWLLARTGVRIGEAVALMWEDIDFNERLIKVERTYYKGRIGSTNNGKPRTVDMSWQLKDALLGLKQGRVVVDIDEDTSR